MDVGAGLYMYDVVGKKFTFAISSPGEFLLGKANRKSYTLYRTVTLPMTLSDPNHHKSPPILRFGSSFMSLEQLDSSNIVHR